MCVNLLLTINSSFISTGNYLGPILNSRMFNYLHPIIFQTETEIEKCTRVASLNVISYKRVLCSVNDDHMKNIKKIICTRRNGFRSCTKKNKSTLRLEWWIQDFPEGAHTPEGGANVLFSIIVSKIA